MGQVDAERFRGFKSPEARRRLFIGGCGVMVLVLVAQVLIGQRLAGFAWGGVRLENVHAETAVLWRGGIWYVASDVTTAFGSPDIHDANHLVRLAADGPKTECKLAAGPAWLLAGEESLWIFSSDGISQYDGKEFSAVPAERMPAPASQPFLFGGRPAVVQEEPGKWRVIALEDGRWVEKPAVRFSGAENSGVAPEDVKVLLFGDHAYVFCRKDGSVYSREGAAAAATGAFPAGWETVCPAPGLWTAVMIGSGSAVFAVKQGKDEAGGEIVGFARGEKGWTQFFSRSAGLAPRTLGVASPMSVFTPTWTHSPSASDSAPAAEGREGGGFTLLYQALPWSVNVARAAEDGKILEARRYGELVPAERGKALRILLPPAATVALVLAIVLAFSRLMAACRVESYSPVVGVSPGRPAGLVITLQNVRFAPLWRRAVAALMDFAILAGPLLAGMVLVFLILPGVEDRADSRALVLLSALLLGGMFWAVGAFFLLSYSLGRWGRTPGKWALGIRALGTDLQPCGFSRAVLRSLLFLVDAFLLNFPVGVPLIAFTANQQRLGDLAARTIVLRETP